jgi:predicted cytidylate kinase
MVITISGTPGSGKTTVSRLISQQLGLLHIYAGDLYRAEAQRRQMRLPELNRQAELDHSIDQQIDAHMAAYARAGNVVLEGRLAGFIARQEGVEALKVWLTASDGTRARRVAAREEGDWKKVLEENRTRHQSDAERYRTIYGFDLSDTSIYDLVLDTDDITPEALAETILEAVRQRFGSTTRKADPGQPAQQDSKKR